jgi:hypothetical protein
MEDLFLIHFIFIVVMSAVSFWWGGLEGQKIGQRQMVFDMLERKLVTEEQLTKEYIDGY